MNEISGLPSALGIEAIDVEPTVGGGMTVRVAGRRHAGSAPLGEPVLLLGAGEARRRLPGRTEAVDDASGAWRVSFAVPDALVTALDGPMWLTVGTVTVPVTLTTAPQPARPAIDPELLLSRELRTLEAAARVARRGQAAAEARADALEAEVERLRQAVADARREPERLRALLAERDRLRRAAEQREFAEAARREELEGELAGVEEELDALTARLHDREARISELEDELGLAERVADEARHALSVGGGGVGGGEVTAPGVESSGRGVPDANARRPVPRRRQARVLSAEVAMLRRVLVGEHPRVPMPAPPSPGPAAAAALAAALAAEDTLAARVRPGPGPRAAASEAAGPEEFRRARARVAELDRALAREAARVAELDAALVAEREARAGATVALERERSAAAERISALQADAVRRRASARRALETVAAFREELAQLRTEGVSPREAPESGSEPDPGSEPGAAPPAAPVQADRLAAALERLRERVPDSAAGAGEAPGDIPEASGSPVADTGLTRPRLSPAPIAPDSAGTAATPALGRLFHALLVEDPASAGRLLLEALPAQHLLYGRPVAYDLVLGEATCVRVTAGGGHTSVEPAVAPRGPAATQFTLTGSRAEIACFLGAGPLRRRFGRRTARLHGERRAVEALDALVGAPVSLRALLDAGVRVDPLLAFGLVAHTVAPGLTRAERFTLAHRPAPEAPSGAVLHVEDGRRLVVSDLPLLTDATCTVVCPPDALLPALVAPRYAGAEVLGDTRALELVQGWLSRA